MVDMEKPQHFTSEQSEWVKQYVIIKNKQILEEVENEIYILKKYAEGMKKNSANLADGPGDYFYGKADAFANMESKLDALLEKLKA